MARFRYVCPECGNTVPAERVEKRVPGSVTHVRVMNTLVCEKDGAILARESYTPPRREVSDR